MPIPIHRAIRKAVLGSSLAFTTGAGAVVDMDAVRAAGLRLGVDPLGGAGRSYWEPINATYGVDITVVYPGVVATNTRVNGYGPDGQPAGRSGLNEDGAMPVEECAGQGVGAHGRVGFVCREQGPAAGDGCLVSRTPGVEQLHELLARAIVVPFRIKRCAALVAPSSKRKSAAPSRATRRSCSPIG